MTPIDRLKAKLTAIADSIRDRTGDPDKMTLDEMSAEIDYMPAGDDGEAYILVDENGNEIPAVLTEEEVDLTATANDIRIGTIAVTDDGVITGEKEIPSYYVAEGSRIVTKGSALFIPSKLYDYTKLQAMVCLYNTDLDNSVAVTKVAILDNVYDVNSIVPLSTVVKDDTAGRVDLGIKNESDGMYILRYFMYKEMY